MASTSCRMLPSAHALASAGRSTHCHVVPSARGKATYVARNHPAPTTVLTNTVQSPTVLCRGSGDSEALPLRMTTEDACKILDVQATASFEEVLAAKNTKLGAAGGDENRVVEVETAYDILFMRAMKKRMSGEIEVSTSVRYADVPPAPPRRGAGAVSEGGRMRLNVP